MNLIINDIPTTAQEYVNRILKESVARKVAGLDLIHNLHCDLAERSHGPSDLLVMEFSERSTQGNSSCQFCAFISLHGMTSDRIVSAVLTAYELWVNAEFQLKNGDNVLVFSIPEAPVVFH